ncbi:hypothetical protein J6590_084437 [Homalodisca vitripennis]|nr:hypothetical protein J6590_084437 [Homalodisca vitripennis]
MHFNAKGKQWLAKQIIKTIQEFNLDQSIAPAESRRQSGRERSGDPGGKQSNNPQGTSP